MNRAEQKEVRREQILRVALDLFVTQGVAGTKITDIAKKANMSVGLLFHYFESKNDLVLELVNIGLSNSKIESLEYSGKAITYFEDIANNILTNLQEDRNIAKMFVFMLQVTNSTILTEKLKYSIKWDNINSTKKIIVDGQVDGSIREGDSTALAIAFWSAIQGICQLVLIDDNMTCPEPSWIVDIIRSKGV